MQIKNKIILKIICLLSLVAFGTNLQADEFNISAKEISIDSAKDIVVDWYMGRDVKEPPTKRRVT